MARKAMQDGVAGNNRPACVRMCDGRTAGGIGGLLTSVTANELSELFIAIFGTASFDTAAIASSVECFIRAWRLATSGGLPCNSRQCAQAKPRCWRATTCAVESGLMRFRKLRIASTVVCGFTCLYLLTFSAGVYANAKYHWV